MMQVLGVHSAQAFQLSMGKGHGRRSATMPHLHEASGSAPSRGPKERACSGGSVFFLDEELALLPGALAPRQQGYLVQLGSWKPCRYASRVLEELLGVDVSPETARRLCEDVGCRVEEKQTAQEPWKEEANARENECRMAISGSDTIEQNNDNKPYKKLSRKNPLRRSQQCFLLHLFCRPILLP